jgi:hypothetical protein
MQKIFFHKTVSLAKPLKELVSISVDESISYKAEDLGIRAIGTIIIHGEYDDGKDRNSFKENIDLDILAPFDKIEDKRDFHVKVEDFDYSISEGVLKLIIQVQVYSIKDDEDKHIHVDNQYVIKEDPYIETLIRENDEETEEVELLENEKQVDNEEASEPMGTYYLYVVSQGDNYSTIAARYNMNEDIIKDYNKNRELQEGSIVIVPYSL